MSKKFTLTLSALVCLGGYFSESGRCTEITPAQSSAPIRKMEPATSLSHLIQEAIEHNPALRSLKYDTYAKEAEAGPAGAWEDPMVYFEMQNYPVDTFSSREFGMTGNQVSIVQKVPFPGRLSRLRESVHAEHRSKSESLRAAEFNLIRDVKLAYYALYLAEKRSAILKDQQDLIRQLIRATRSKYSVGKAPQSELLNLQVEEASLMGELLAADKEVAVKSTELQALVANQADAPIAHISEVSITKIDMTKVTEAALLERAFEANPSLRAARADLEASVAKSSYSKMGYLPGFEFKMGYTFRKPNGDDRGVDLLSAGVGLSIPLWFAARQTGEVRQAGFIESRAEALLDQQRLELIRQTKTLYSELQESYGKLRLFEGGLLPLARQAVVSGQSSYLTGQMQFSSLLNAVTTRFKTELMYYEATVNYESTIARLEALFGDSLGGLK